MNMKCNDKILVEMEIVEHLLEFAEIAKEDITTSDLQGIAGAKAKDIIELIKTTL